jgi:hypothetical protein
MSALEALARDVGIDVTWQTQSGDRAKVREETLLALVNLLGLEVRTPADADTARRSWHQQRMDRVVEPTTVVWDAQTPRLRVYVPEARADAPFECHVELDGHEWHAPVSKLPIDVMPAGVDKYLRMDVRLPLTLPPGVHTARISGAGLSGASTVLATPSRIPTNGARRAWGVFAPLYALYDAVDDSPATLATLGRFGTWAQARGAQVVGTLPLLATFYGAGREPCDPSP